MFAGKENKQCLLRKKVILSHCFRKSHTHEQIYKSNNILFMFSSAISPLNMHLLIRNQVLALERNGYTSDMKSLIPKANSFDKH